MTRQVIYVAGIVSYDFLIYPMQNPPDDPEVAGSVMQMVVCPGSANLVAQLLNAAAPQWNLEVVGPELHPPVSNSLKHHLSSVIDLENQTSGSSSFSVVKLRHIGRAPTWHSPRIDRSLDNAVDKVVIIGSGQAFRDVEPALDFLQHVKPKFIIHYMTRPLAVGRLWDFIRNGPLTTDGLSDPDHLAVIVDADDLRAEGISLSQSLSWEATAEDFVRNLGSNGRLDTLVTCPNLIVRFGIDGVIYHRGRDAVNPKIYFYPRQIEARDFNMIGSAMAFTAGFAVGFPDGDAGIRLGMSASKGLLETGFVSDTEDGSPIYPIETVMKNCPSKSQSQISVVNVPSNNISSGESFSILKNLIGDPAEVARKVVTLGPDNVLALCPTRRFGQLQSFERAEQESLGSIVETINERLDAGHTAPTCVGITGPTGSGKKFAAANLVDHIAADRSIRRLSYNGNLMKSNDLIEACHTVQDNATANCTTVVTIENFESILEADDALLLEFLSLMRDGVYMEGSHKRSIGRCVLLILFRRGPIAFDVAFETALAPTVSDSNRRRTVDDSVLLDCLHGVVQLSGPNQLNSKDKMFCVRRALMLRQLIRDKHPHLESSDGKIIIDDAVLHALLFVPSYKHGLRSLEKIVSMSRLTGRKKFDVSALPPEEQIQLHVDGNLFMAYLRSPKLPPTLRERLAEGLFETYKKQRKLMCKTEEERQALLSDRSMADWDELAGELKESTRAQADDIPRKLRAINCFMLNEERSDPLVLLPEFSTKDLDLLSEMEHERFNAERLQRQWRMGARNSKQRTTPFLVPWRDLTQEWKDVDRVMVECVPRVLAANGYRIYRMKDES